MRSEGYSSWSVCVSVRLSVPANLRSQAMRRENSDTNGLSATWTLFQMLRFSYNVFVQKLWRETRVKKANMHFRDQRSTATT